MSISHPKTLPNLVHRGPSYCQKEPYNCSICFAQPSLAADKMETPHIFTETPKQSAIVTCLLVHSAMAISGLLLYTKSKTNTHIHSHTHVGRPSLLTAICLSFPSAVLYCKASLNFGSCRPYQLEFPTYDYSSTRPATPLARCLRFLGSELSNPLNPYFQNIRLVSIDIS